MNCLYDLTVTINVILFFSFKALLIEACDKKWKSFGNSCYSFVTPDDSKYGPVKSNWSTARSHCLKERADLVSLTTQEEVDFVYSHTKNKAYRFWIGLTYETQVKNNTPWTWSNGDILNVTQWNRGEPNKLNKEHCTHILKRRKYWNNLRCDFKNAWICEKTKMIKTAVKATGGYCIFYCF